MTKTDIVSTSYKDDRRISNAIITVDKSDDIYALASLQRQYENVLAAIDDAKAKKQDTTALEKDRDRIKISLDEQQNIVNGYNSK